MKFILMIVSGSMLGTMIGLLILGFTEWHLPLLIWATATTITQAIINDELNRKNQQQ